MKCVSVLEKMILEEYKFANSYQDINYFSLVSTHARTWAAEHIREVREGFQASRNSQRESILKELTEIENRIPDMRYPFEDKD